MWLFFVIQGGFVWKMSTKSLAVAVWTLHTRQNKVPGGCCYGSVEESTRSGGGAG